MGDKTCLLAQLSAAVARRDRAQAKAQADVHRAILAAVAGGCSLAEIGREMGIDRQTVRWHIGAARKALEPPLDETEDRP